MLKHLYVEVEFDCEWYEAYVSVDAYVDQHYGEDADGNRGTTRSFVNDINIKEVFDKSGLQITPSPQMIERINALATEKYFQ